MTLNDIEPCDWGVIEDFGDEPQYYHKEPNYNYD